jgi:virginiamycin B lyase
LLATARFALVFLVAGFLAACGGGTPITSGTPTPAPTLSPAVTSQYPIPTASSQPMSVALGIDGNIWITEFAKSKIGQLEHNGKISENVTPTRKSGPIGIASGPGPNVNMWFTEANVAQIGEITTAGPPYIEYSLPDSTARPYALALGSDGNMWCTDPGTDSIWKIEAIKAKPHVRFTQYKLAANAQPLTITNGPDGALWFTEPGINRIGRLPVSGYPLREYKIPTANSGPAGIAPANDNALWFLEMKAKKIGRMSVTGEVTAEYPLNGAMTPNQLVQGIDGNFYFTDTDLNKIGQFITRGHHVAFYHIPTANSKPTALTLGLDSQVYFVETAGNKIAQFRYFDV